MEEKEVIEVLNEYRDSHSERKLLKLLKDKLIEEMEGWDVSTDRQEHGLNMMVREIEEELDYIESEKLSEFDPERS
ncbi:hypothetical protein [Candidatus Nanohalococcus occultus]|uniref:Uncharacterized protein n=1 Tax=Candidatus Nanohalococcus occultus TaxID=2978047 RepID=A0ABY8CI10_9ARCH|nr:hypothetical protein SVXNc_0287 [Candidatus Nanohaloarchaeota archaeon SVXNc]